MTTLAHPGNITGAVISGDKLGTSGDDFYIQVADATFRFKTKYRSITGDGDADIIKLAHNKKLYGAVYLRGWMIASQAVGFANMIDSSKNPVGITFNLDGGQELNMTILIHDSVLRWEAEGTYIPIAFIAAMSHTDIDDVSDPLEDSIGG